LAAIEELQYRPHAIARSLKTGNTFTVGLLVQSLLQSYIGHLVNTVEDSLASRDYGLILASSHEDCEREKRLLDVLADQLIDGLIYIPVSCRNGDRLNRYIKAGIPVVFMDRYLPDVPADVVMTDNISAARQATKYLIDQGCRHNLCISFSEEASSALDRVEGFCQAHQERGLPVHEHMVLVVKYAAGQKVEPTLLDHLDTYGVPDGILCTTEDFIVGAIKALKQQGLRIPDQVRVTGGFFDSPWNALLEPPVPIVRQDFQAVANKAVEFLMDRINGDDSPPKFELVQAEFIS
jgi:LacI family transcriptional regulator